VHAADCGCRPAGDLLIANTNSELARGIANLLAWEARYELKTVSLENPLLRRGGATRRGGFPDQQPTPGSRSRPQNPPEVPPCPRGDAVFERGAALGGMKNSLGKQNEQSSNGGFRPVSNDGNRKASARGCANRQRIGQLEDLQ
jgi:hypothetical protein